MFGTLYGMELGQELTVFSTNNLFLSLHEGPVTPLSLSLSVTVSVMLHYLTLTMRSDYQRVFKFCASQTLHNRFFF
jgi:hypothetical protein